MRGLITVLLFCLVVSFQPARADERLDLGTLYKVTMLRADPGKLEDLINFYKAQQGAGYFKAIGQTPPMIMRHSQGDHWDLFLLQPIGSYGQFYGPEMEALRAANAGDISKHIMTVNNLTVFREELFSYGPNQALVEQEFSDNGYFHLELFAALAGMHDELIDQRIRENAYIEAIGQKANLVWVGDTGTDIDSFTIGFYKDLQAFATPSPATPEEREKAATDNGFKSRNHIGFNLREFLAYHQDTLATKVSYDD